jgi:hypothetical protein
VRVIPDKKDRTMRRLLGAAITAGVLSAGLLAPAAATNTGHDGCTPGYWKNHTDNWEEASPNQLVISIYDVSPALALVTLEQALSLQGGPGLDGRPPLRKYVNEALASGDRATMLAAANRLDADNNLGCPL